MARFFSDEWGDGARAMWNTSKAVQEGLADPESFTYVMEMGVTDIGLSCQLEIEHGKCVYWGSSKRPPEKCDFQIWADLAVWQQVTGGELNPIAALSSRQIDFRKGPISEAIRNATAFEGVMVGMGTVETDWNI